MSYAIDSPLPTVADLKLQRMRERFESGAALSKEQAAIGDAVARYMEPRGIDHRMIFAYNGAVVIADVTLQLVPSGEVVMRRLVVLLKAGTDPSEVANELDHGLRFNTDNAASPGAMKKFRSANPDALVDSMKRVTDDLTKEMLQRQPSGGTGRIKPKGTK